MSGSELGLQSGWMYNITYLCTKNGDTDDEIVSKERKALRRDE